jgi:hypothetical protein
MEEQLITEDTTMIYSPQDQEYSARFGLKNALDDIEVAQRIAEEKYRTLVGRDVFISEISGIHRLIEELRGWVGQPHSSSRLRETH